MQPEVVGGDVGEHRDVVVGQPDALEQDAAAGGLGDRELHLLVGQHPARARRAGVVAGLDQLAVDVDAVGARPADVQAVRAGDVRDHPRGGGLAVGAGDRDDRHPRAAAWWARGRARRRAPVGGVADQLLEVGAEQRVEHLGDRPAERLGAGPVAPRVGHHDLVHVVGRPDPHARAGSCRPPRAIWRTSRSIARAANRCRKPLPGCPGRALRRPIRVANRMRHPSWRVDQRGEVQGELDRGAREVQVRSFEDPELDECGSHPHGRYRARGARQAPIAW